MAEEKGNTIKVWWSMWALLARSCFYKILTVLVLMVSLEGLFLYWNLQNPVKSLGFVIAGSRACSIFIAALGAVFLILVWMENMLDSKSQYTLMRLKVTQMQFFFMKVVFNILCLTLLFAVRIGMAFWMAELCIKKGEYGGDAGQTLFLAFYYEEFLHCLLPMAEAGKWVRNILLVLAFSMEAALCDKKKNYWAVFLLFALTAFGFVSPIGFNSLDAACDGAYFTTIAVSAVGLWKKRRNTVELE